MDEKAEEKRGKIPNHTQHQNDRQRNHSTIYWFFPLNIPEHARLDHFLSLLYLWITLLRTHQVKLQMYKETCIVESARIPALNVNFDYLLRYRENKGETPETFYFLNLQVFFENRSALISTDHVTKEIAPANF